MGVVKALIVHVPDVDALGILEELHVRIHLEVSLWVGIWSRAE